MKTGDMAATQLDDDALDAASAGICCFPDVCFTPPEAGRRPEAARLTQKTGEVADDKSGGMAR